MSIPKHLIDFPADFGCRMDEDIPVVIFPTLTEIKEMCASVVTGNKKSARDVIYYWSHGHPKELNQDARDTFRLLENAFMYIFQNEFKFT